MQGWLKLPREILDWCWYQNNNVKALFFHFLLRARHKDGKWNTIELKAGQLVTSYLSISIETGMSISQVRTALDKLESTGDVIRESNSEYTLITIPNWHKYQVQKENSNEIASNPHSNREQNTTNNNGNNVDNVDSECETRAYGYHSNVNLSDEEYSFLPKKVAKYKDYIDKLSDHIASTGIKYHSHYATIIKWARQDGNLIDCTQPQTPFSENYKVPEFYINTEE